MYGIRRFYLWLFLCLAVVQAVPALRAVTSSLSGGMTYNNGTTASGSGSITSTTITGNYSTGWTVGYTYTMSVTGYSTVAIYTTSRSGTSSDVVRLPWTECNGNTPGRTKSGSGTFTVPAGQDVVTFCVWVQGPAEGNQRPASAVELPLGVATQTITVTPTSGTITKGEEFVFNVSGNQTSPSFSTDGVSLWPDGYHKTFDQIGIHTFNVWAPAGSGYTQSNTVTVTVTVRGYRVKVPLAANTTDYTMMYDIIQGGVTVTTLVQLKGAAARTQIVEVPTSAPVTISPRLVGVTKDDEIWVKDAEGETVLTPSIVTPVPVVSEDEEIPEPNIPAPSVPPSGPSDSTKTVWSKKTEGDMSAKDKTIMEGTDKIVSKLDDINATLKARLHPDGGGSFDMTGVESRLDTANTHLQVIAEHAQAQKDAKDANPTDGPSKSASGRGNIEAAFGSQDLPAFSSPAPAAPGSAFTVTLPGVGEMNLDPASDPQVSALCSFIRQVIAWCCLVIYLWWAWGEFKTLCNMLTISHQAVGNAVIGGTGGQATALVAAVAITVLVVSFPSLFWAYLQLPEGIASNPFVGAAGPAQMSLYLLYLVIPVGLILTLIGQAFVLRKFGLVAAMSIATAIRFIVP